MAMTTQDANNRRIESVKYLVDSLHDLLAIWVEGGFLLTILYIAGIKELVHKNKNAPILFRVL